MTSRDSMQQPNERPAAPMPVLPVEHTAREMEDVYLRPSRIAGCVEVVRRLDGVTRALLKEPEP